MLKEQLGSSNFTRKRVELSITKRNRVGFGFVREFPRKTAKVSHFAMEKGSYERGENRGEQLELGTAFLTRCNQIESELRNRRSRGSEKPDSEFDRRRTLTQHVLDDQLVLLLEFHERAPAGLPVRDRVLLDPAAARVRVEVVARVDGGVDRLQHVARHVHAGLVQAQGLPGVGVLGGRRGVGVGEFGPHLQHGFGGERTVNGAIAHRSGRKSGETCVPVEREG